MIDLVASDPRYRAHAGPVWAALPAGLRGPGDAALVASWTDHRMAIQRGYRRIVVMEHGAGQSYSNDNPGYPGGARRPAGLYLTPNEHAAARWRAAYPGARVEVVGCPRLDELPARDRGAWPETTVAITFHNPLAVAPETRPALKHFARALPELARSAHLIGHSHPRYNLESLYRSMGIEYVRSSDEVCRRADLLVADNTSFLFEFAATGRPVIVMNAPWYRRGANHGLRFWDAADVGIQVDEPAALVSAVAEALEDAPARQAAREAALGIVYAFRTGAAARAVETITDWLDVSARNAA